MTNKQGLVDAWTPGHVLIGAVTRRAGLSPIAALGVWVAFEVLENTVSQLDGVKQQIPSSGPESGTNIVGDLLANAAGYALMEWRMSRSR